MIPSLVLWCSLIGCAATHIALPPQVLYIDDDIDSDTAIDAFHLASNLTSNELRVHINSHGGLVNASEAIVTLFQALQGAGVRVRCLVDGTARSGAFWILQACGERLATPKSDLLIHEPFIMGSGQIILTMETLISMHDELQHDSEQMAALCAPRLGLTLIAFHEKIKNKPWTMTAQQGILNHALDSIYTGTKEGFLK